MQIWLKRASLLLALAVCFGAFGAHVLKGRVDISFLVVFEKGIFYHFIHALAIFLVATLVPQKLISESGGQQVCRIFFLGIVLFSGSLYLLVLSGEKFFGMITPLGGLCFIFGWLRLVFIFRRTTSVTEERR